MSWQGHLIHLDSFCYVCAKLIRGQKRNFSDSLQNAYWNYFKTSCSDVSKPFTPSFLCQSCYRNLYRYNSDHKYVLPFNCPAIWTQSINHLDGECYFCTVKRPRLNESIQYVDCSNCKLPTNNSINLAERVPPEESGVTSDNEANSGSEFSLEEEKLKF